MNIESLVCPNCGAGLPDNIHQGKLFKCNNCASTLVWPERQPALAIRFGTYLCPACGTDNEQSRNYCRYSGTLLTKKCPKCNMDYYVGDVFCPNGHNYEIESQEYKEQEHRKWELEQREGGKMNSILKEFTTNITADREMIKFSQGRNVVFSFPIKDINQTIFMAFIDGKVSAGLEAPPHDPDVKVTMDADTLDGIFTGRVNATKAATSGKMTFSGNTGKAMTFIHIQSILSRLYSEVRQKIGDPGDLSKPVT